MECISARLIGKAADVDEGGHNSNYDDASSDASTYGSRPTWYRAKTAALAQVPSAPNMRAAAHTRTTEMSARVRLRCFTVGRGEAGQGARLHVQVEEEAQRVQGV